MLQPCFRIRDVATEQQHLLKIPTQQSFLSSKASQHMVPADGVVINKAMETLFHDSTSSDHRPSPAFTDTNAAKSTYLELDSLHKISYDFHRQRLF